MDYITTANVLAWFFVSLGFFLMFVSYWVAGAALFPLHVERCDRHYNRPVLATLIGLFAGVVPIALGILIMQKLPPALKWIGLLLIAAPIFIGLIGSAGLARRIGVGLASPQDGSQPWRAILRGGIVLALTFLLPILGQLLIPMILASGLGTSIFAWTDPWKEAREPRGALPSDLDVPQPQP